MINGIEVQPITSFTLPSFVTFIGIECKQLLQQTLRELVIPENVSDKFNFWIF